MEPDVHTFITYFDDRQVEEYNLFPSETVTLFKGNDTSYPGESINHLNIFFCELCTMYYVWKNNLSSDYVVFKQYRRPFNWEVRRLPKKGQVITYEKTYLYNPMYIHYAICHGKNRAQDIMDILYNNDMDCFNYWKDSLFMYTNNSIVIGWEDFTKMCEFVFNILEKIDEHYELNHDFARYADNALKYTEDGRLDYQKHWMAYIGERLISYYIDRKLKAITIPRLTENNGFFKPWSPTK